MLFRSDFLRNAQAFVFAYGLEGRLEKEQVLEIYLNVARFPGNALGIDAAARRHFEKGAGSLSDDESVLLVASLDDPDTSDPADPATALKQRSEALLEQISEIDMGTGSSAADAENDGE